MVVGDLLKNPIAHRGLHGLNAPENSLAAFEAAARAGYAIELDAQIIASGEMIVFHDQTLERLCGVRGAVRDLQLKDMDAIRLIGGEKVPLLREVFERIKTPIYLEIKSDLSYGKAERTRLVTAVLELLNEFRPNAIAASFDRKLLALFRRRSPEIMLGIISEDDTPNLALFEAIAPKFVSVSLPSLPLWKEAMIGKNLPLIAWTAHNETESAQALIYADQVVFEGFLPPVSGDLQRTQTASCEDV
ncbi:glycerophosphoryl diester phosphodiesterase [Campylobacterota bacterium]|nr:glycerophosphoryl diester phosphodiesterase [Campylobacterota bacterium]